MKVMSYTDVRGVNYTGSLWRLDAFLIDLPNKIGEFTFNGYSHLGTWQAGKEKIGTQIFTVTAATFDYYLNLHLASGLNIPTIAYRIAQEQLIDSGLTTPVGNPPAYIPIMTGFFANAIADIQG